MADKDTSLDKIFFVSKLTIVFPLRRDKRGFYRCSKLTGLCFANISLMIYAIVHISTIDNPPLINNSVSSPLFISVRWMKALETAVFVLCPLFNVDRLNDIQKAMTYTEDSLCDYVTSLRSPKVWSYSSVYTFINLVIFISSLVFSLADAYFLILTFWIVFTNHILECQFLGLIELFEMRFTELLELVQTLARRKRPSLTKCIKLSRIHRTLSESLINLNESFSLQLLTHTTTCFVFLAVQSYYIILLSCEKFVLKTIVHYIVQIILVITGFSNFYIIANKAQNITIKARAFTAVLYQLMQRETTNVLSGNKTLWLHIVWKRDVVLTVCGFFNLDLTLVYSMIGAVTTYLAIILQFSERAT